LWHIPISHYNEKARWALAYKGVEHERRTPLPGAGITPERMDAFRDPLRERRGYRWVEEMFARHRRPATVAA
jgi:hypothetical protein